jgi:hypothetical protein
MGSSDVHTESFEGDVPEEPTVDKRPVEAVQSPSVEDEHSTEQSSRRNLYMAIGASALLVLGAGAGIGFLAAKGGPNNIAPQPDNKDRQVNVSTPSSIRPSNEIPTDSASPKASDTGLEAGFSPSLSPEDMGRAVIQKAFIDWRNDHVNSQLASTVDQLGLGVNRYSILIPQQDEATFTNKLFVNNWKASSGLSLYAQTIEAQNSRTIDLAYATAKDTTPFTWRDEIQTINVEDAGSQEVNEIILINDYNNSSENTAASIDPSLTAENGQLLHFDVRLIRVGNVMKLSSLAEVAITQ